MCSFSQQAQGYTPWRWHWFQGAAWPGGCEPLPLRLPLPLGDVHISFSSADFGRGRSAGVPGFAAHGISPWEEGTRQCWQAGGAAGVYQYPRSASQPDAPLAGGVAYVAWQAP